jgi:hypothetical protein
MSNCRKESKTSSKSKSNQVKEDAKQPRGKRKMSRDGNSTTSISSQTLLHSKCMKHDSLKAEKHRCHSRLKMKVKESQDK